MLYFAYAHDVNYRSLVEWCDLTGRRAPLPRRQSPAVAINQRLAFPIYSDYWQGGVAGLMPDPGKRVSGAMLDLPDNQLDLISEFFDRRLDQHGKERGAYKLVELTIEPYGKGERRIAHTFLPTLAEEGHVPPSRLYVDRLIEASLDLELSAMWVMHLRSCLTGPEESSRFFPTVAGARSGESRQLDGVSSDPAEIFNAGDVPEVPAEAASSTPTPSPSLVQRATIEPRGRTMARLRSRANV
jgi:hypothetical protein